jgi:hypothetical protein
MNTRASEELYEWLGEQLDTIAEAQRAPVGVNSRRWRNSFLHGLTQRVGERLKEWRAEQEALTPKGMALVVRVDAENSDYLNSKYPNLRTTHTKISYNRQAHAAGRGAADAVTLNPSNRTMESVI